MAQSISSELILNSIASEVSIDFQVDVWKIKRNKHESSTNTRAQHGTSTSCAASTCFTIFPRLVGDRERERARRQLISLFFNKHYLPSQLGARGGERNIKHPTLLRQLFDEGWRLLHDTTIIIIIAVRNMRWEFTVDERSVGRSFQLMLGSAVVESRDKICHKNHTTREDIIIHCGDFGKRSWVMCVANREACSVW